MASAIAARYARALADVVSRTGEYRRAQEELAAFADVYRQSAELRDVLKTPAVSVNDKTKILEAILARLGTSLTLANFFRVLLANYRLGLVDDIIEAFEKLVTGRLGIARVKISSAAELTPAEQQALTARFEAVTGKKVEATFHTVPALLGGVTAQIESTVYDGSVRGHLERIREKLISR
jgi:F-type H+-transporting ATPase subunit delta